MKTVVAGVLSTFLLAGSASALTLSVNCTGLPAASGTFSNTELNGNVVCPQFNVAGTLTSISIAVTGATQGTITISNTSSASQSGSASTNSAFTVGPLTGFSIASPLFTVSASTGNQTVAAGATQAFNVNGSNSAVINNAGVSLGLYTGASSFNIPVVTLTSLGVTFSGGNVLAGQATKARADAVVTYTYNPLTTVPEPTTLALLGTGLVGAVARRRRKN